MADYSKSDFAQSLGISKQELENRARGAGFSTTEDYYKSTGGGATGSNVAAVRPAVQSYEQSIPETQQAFTQQRTQLQAEQAPLEKRYANLLQSIKGNQQTAENRQTLATANELARRGISNTSGLFQQELASAVNPLTQQYSTQYTDVGLQGEAAQRQLANQLANTYTGETESLRAIRNAIAQLQAGAGQTDVAQGIQKSQFQKEQERLASATKADEDYRKMIYENIDLPRTQYELNKPYYKPEEAGLTVADLQGLKEALGLDGNDASDPDYFTPVNSKPVISSITPATAGKYGGNLG